MIKTFRSLKYNYKFNDKNGFFIRWGENANDDPEYSPFGPEILDIEISTICFKACSWCYKSNTLIGKYMSFENFKKLFSKFPNCLTQIAFGIGDIDSNPDLYQIMNHCRINKIIPNITINGDRMTDYHYKQLVSLCGAVAVSHYDDNTCFNAIEKLSKEGLKQVNIHKLLCEETYDDCFKIINSNIKGLNAIVFLWLKPKGIRNSFTQLTSLKKYKKLVDYAFEKKASIGFDSCSASTFLKAVKNNDNFKELEMMVEPCESTLFSYYINVDGVGYPCSFTEGETNYEGIDVLNCNNFIKDVWFNEETKKFRDKLINNKNCMNCRVCQEFNLEVV